MPADSDAVSSIGSNDDELARLVATAPADMDVQLSQWPVPRLLTAVHDLIVAQHVILMRSNRLMRIRTGSGANDKSMESDSNNNINNRPSAESGVLDEAELVDRIDAEYMRRHDVSTAIGNASTTAGEMSTTAGDISPLDGSLTGARRSGATAAATGHSGRRRRRHRRDGRN